MPDAPPSSLRAGACPGRVPPSLGPPHFCVSAFRHFPPYLGYSFDIRHLTIDSPPPAPYFVASWLRGFVPSRECHCVTLRKKSVLAKRTHLTPWLYRLKCRRRAARRAHQFGSCGCGGFSQLQGQSRRSGHRPDPPQSSQADIHEGQNYLFTEYRDRFVITDIPPSDRDPAEVFCFAYGRCDQENIIEQFKNGIAALRMPTGELLANSAFLMAGQLAWYLRSWLSRLALPQQTTRWEWKCFRQAFVYVAARITRHARRAVVVLTDGHRFVEHLLVAAQGLQSFVFR